LSRKKLCSSSILADKLDQMSLELEKFRENF
jgi:hypothetical protein